MYLHFISDTHGSHWNIKFSSLVGEGDILVHGGDYSNHGNIQEAAGFLNWFGEQPHQYKIFISGNHDGASETDSALFKSLIPSNVIYLQDSGCEIEGIKFWGSPVTPRFFNWYWNRDRGKDIKKHWDMIPKDTDVLITHGPPMGILDWAQDHSQRDPVTFKLKKKMIHVGCQDLMDRVKIIKPKIHVFGHLHLNGGKTTKFNGTTFINASSLNESYDLVNEPVKIDYDKL